MNLDFANFENNFDPDRSTCTDLSETSRCSFLNFIFFFNIFVTPLLLIRFIRTSGVTNHTEAHLNDELYLNFFFFPPDTGKCFKKSPSIGAINRSVPNNFSIKQSLNKKILKTKFPNKIPPVPPINPTLKTSIKIEVRASNSILCHAPTRSYQSDPRPLRIFIIFAI